MGHTNRRKELLAEAKKIGMIVNPRWFISELEHAIDSFKSTKKSIEKLAKERKDHAL